MLGSGDGSRGAIEGGAPRLACGVDVQEGREQQGALPLGERRWRVLRWEELRTEGFCCVESSVLVPPGGEMNLTKTISSLRQAY